MSNTNRHREYFETHQSRKFTNSIRASGAQKFVWLAPETGGVR